VRNNTHVFINNNNEGQNDPSNIFEIRKIKHSDEVPAYKYLGVYFDPQLTFKFHISQLLKKLNRAIYTLRTVKNFLPTESMTALYYSLFHCHLIYACEIWSSASDNLLNQIYKKQKIAIRIINNSKYNDHTKPLFKMNGILPLEQLIQYTKLNFTHGIIYNRAPISFSDSLLTNAQNRQINHLYDRELRNDGDLYIPFLRTSQISKFPLISFPTLWNTLPPDLSMI